jgi:hypothetical protein
MWMLQKSNFHVYLDNHALCLNGICLNRHIQENGKDMAKAACDTCRLLPSAVVAPTRADERYRGYIKVNRKLSFRP